VLPELKSLVQLSFLAFIALFPVVNPIGTAFVVVPYFAGVTAAQKRTAVRRITLYSFCVCVAALLVGHWILMLFGLSIPVVQVAGGIMICKMGWQHLSADEASTPVNGQPPTAEVNDYATLRERLFYPLTFPLTTGAGTISVVFTLSAQGAGSASDLHNDLAGYFMNVAAIVLAVVAMCMLVYFFYLNTGTFVRSLGQESAKIFDRLMAFLIFCVGLQIAVNGAKALYHAL
jgi:multiple antibiotic resistance protein